MQKFTKRDLGFSVLTGLITGVIMWLVLEYLHVPQLGAHQVYCIKAPCPPLGGLPWASLVIIVPIAWIIGVNLGYFLGRWFEFFNQFGKFVAIGFTNFAVSLGILNVLLALTGYASGYGYMVINSAAFIGAMLMSYVWNKYWAFNAGQSGGGGREFVKFFVVTVVAFGVNLAAATAVVNLVHPAFGLTLNQWANVGTVVGAAAGLIFSFIGFKLAVFR